LPLSDLNERFLVFKDTGHHWVPCPEKKKRMNGPDALIEFERSINIIIVSKKTQPLFQVLG
jgi:hypothetical protein